MQRKRARLPLWATMVALAVVASVACSGATDTPATEGSQEPAEQVQTTAPESQETAAAEPYVVEWWGQPRGEFDPIIDQYVVETFNSSHEDVQLQYVRRENHEDLVRIALQAHNAPDIIQTNGPTESAELARAGLLVPLDQYAAQYGWEDELLPWAYQAGFVDGHLYSVPLTYETMLLYYNAALFAEHGWTPPTSRADIEFLCGEAEKLGIACFANGTGGRASRGEWWLGWHLNAGAGPDKVYQALRGEIPWTDPAIAEAITRNKDWIQAGWYNGGLDKYFTLSHDENWVLLSSGQALMRVSGNWDLSRLVSFCPEDCDWVPAPSLSPEIPTHFELAVGESLSISVDSENPDQAAKVLDHLFNDRTRAAKLIEEMGFSTWTVPLKWQSEDFSGGADPRLTRYLEEFSATTGEGRFGYASWTFFPPRTRTYLFEGFESVLMDDISVTEYLEELQAVFSEEIGTGPPIPGTSIQH